MNASEARALQEECGQLVGREVLACASQIVEHVLQREADIYDDMENMCVRTCPECGEHVNENVEDTDDDDGGLSYQCEHCEHRFDRDCEAESELQEVYEWWIVTGWLANKLAERGEVVCRDFHGLTVWGRCCTGQAILLDDVIVQIWKSLQSDAA